jgi:hypothetical protein
MDARSMDTVPALRRQLAEALVERDQLAVGTAVQAECSVTHSA